MGRAFRGAVAGGAPIFRGRYGDREGEKPSGGLLYRSPGEVSRVTGKTIPDGRRVVMWVVYHGSTPRGSRGSDNFAQRPGRMRSSAARPNLGGGRRISPGTVYARVIRPSEARQATKGSEESRGKYSYCI